MKLSTGKVRADDLTDAQQKELRRIVLEFFKAAADGGLLREAVGDLLTDGETVMLGRRLQVAKMLLEGKGIRAISRALRIGQPTIERVDQWLKIHWHEYRLYLNKRTNDDDRKDADPRSFRNLRRKFPLHFLLWNLALRDIDWSKRK